MKLLKSLIIITMSIFTFSNLTYASGNNIITVTSNKTFDKTVNSLVESIKLKNIKVFSIIDQSAEAKVVGESLLPTVLVIFGNPKAGTIFMVKSKTSGLDLPLKILVTERDGKVELSYIDFNYVVNTHNIGIPNAANNINKLVKSLIEEASK